ncbi:MAG: hypothetical protein NT163_05625 [Chlorobiales bacterium]|nr:hypothetical protein [Chlorobiales bacterium]
MNIDALKKTAARRLRNSNPKGGVQRFGSPERYEARCGCRQPPWPRPAKELLPRYAVSLGIRIFDF